MQFTVRSMFFLIFFLTAVSFSHSVGGRLTPTLLRILGGISIPATATFATSSSVKPHLALAGLGIKDTITQNMKAAGEELAVIAHTGKIRAFLGVFAPEIALCKDAARIGGKMIIFGGLLYFAYWLSQHQKNSTETSGSIEGNLA